MQRGAADGGIGRIASEWRELGTPERIGRLAGVARNGTEDAMTDETAPPMMDQIVRLAPSELLSEEGAACLLDSFEADRDLGWDRSNLSFELQDHPRRALKWALVAAAAERYVADLEVAIKKLRAQLDAHTRQTFTSNAVKFTEAMVGAAIDADPAYQEALHTLHEASAKARVCSDMRELFRHRKDLLVQEALQLRMEGTGGDPMTALDLRRRQSALADLERRAATLGEAAALAGSEPRPIRTPVR